MLNWFQFIMKGPIKNLILQDTSKIKVRLDKSVKIVTKVTLGKILFSLHNRPIVVLALVNTISRRSSNFNLESNNVTPRCYWKFLCETSVLIKNTWCSFLLNKTWACVVGSEVKFTRTQASTGTQLLTLFKSSFSSFVEALILG